MLAGRDLLLAHVAGLLQDDRPVALVGEAGVGKSSLLEALIEARHSAGDAVYCGGALATLGWMEHLCLRRALGRDLVGADVDAMAADVQGAVGFGLLVLEDLHWAQPDTLEVIERLTGRVRMVVTVRSGDTGSQVALKALYGAGFEVLEVAGLDETTARALVQASNPGLSGAAVDLVLRRSGGNPLLLTELAAHNEPPATLLLAVGARLRTLDPAAREVFDLLALAGREVPVAPVGPDLVERLTADGLVIRTADTLTVRHALLAEAAIDLMTPERRRQAHATLAGLIDDPGEAARHHQQAGQDQQAIEKALLAARSTHNEVERAGHLLLAARLSTGPEADRLRLQAAEVLDLVHNGQAVLEVLALIDSADAEVQARVALLTARSAWYAGRADLLRSALSTGLALTDGLETEIAVRLRIERSRIPMFLDLDRDAAHAQAVEALALAERTGIAVHRAKYYLGTARLMFDDPETVVLLDAAVEGARAVGDLETERASANNLISYHEANGDPEIAMELARSMIDRAGRLGLGAWTATFSVALAGVLYHQGRIVEAFPVTDRVVDLPGDQRSRDRATEIELLSLIDLGRTDEAERRAEAAAARAADDYLGQVSFLRIRAEAALWGGHPRRALSVVEKFLTGLDGDVNLTFGLPVRGWAQWELGLAPTACPPIPPTPLLGFIHAEIAGLQLLAGGDPVAAAPRFAVAAELASGYHRRAEFRCRWAQGEALRLAGRPADAIRILELVEAEAATLQHGMILGRIRQSLRRLGVQRTAPRSAGRGGVSDREREVLALAGQGLTNAQIAARLGVGRRTVVSLIATASAKLGATSRAQAVALVDA